MLYPKKTCQKKLQKSKDLNILRQGKNLKSKLALLKNSIKNSVIILNLIKMKKSKYKTKELVPSQIQSTISILYFTNITTLMNFSNVL